MERRLAAILAADVVGYSHLMAEDEAGTYDALRSTLSEIVIPTVERHGGDLFKTTGDGFLASFNSVGEALEAAVAIQEAFASRPLRLRIGINLGDVIPADGDVFGDGVNIAARLESMADPGGIYVSAPVVRRTPGIRFVQFGPGGPRTWPSPSRSTRRAGARPPNDIPGHGRASRCWSRPWPRRSLSLRASFGRIAALWCPLCPAQAGCTLTIRWTAWRARSVRRWRCCPSTT